MSRPGALDFYDSLETIWNFTTGSVHPCACGVFEHGFMAALRFLWASRTQRAFPRMRWLDDSRFLVSVLSWNEHRWVAGFGLLACLLYLAVVLLPVL